MKKKIITVIIAFSVLITALIVFFVFSPVSIIGGKAYNKNKLNELSKQYENDIKVIIENKTYEIINYIDSYYDNSNTEILTKTDLIEFKNNNNKIVFSIPAIQIDNEFYSSAGINELQNSMRIISSYLINKIKNTLIKGVDDQTEIYIKNIKSYTDWFYSPFVRFDLAGTKVLGFLFGEKSVEEKYFAENFDRIMNENADFDYIIKDDFNVINNIIINIYYEYLEIKNYFYLENSNMDADILSINDFIEPYIYNIAAYFDQVFGALENANIFYHHEYTIKDNNLVNQGNNAIKTAVNLLSGVEPISGFIISKLFDYAALKTQESLNRSDLEQQITNSMIQNQTNKIEIIKDPFNYLFDKLTVGSLLFVDNYIAGFNAFQHYGVYIGNKKVIHFAPQEGQELNIANLQESFESAVIHETTLEKFLNGRALQIDMNSEKKFPETEIIRRARSRINEKEYDLFLNNCEHFARWCVTGENVSYQVESLPQKIDNTWSFIQKNYYMISDFLKLFS